MRHTELGAALCPKPTMGGSWAALPGKHESVLGELELDVVPPCNMNIIIAHEPPLPLLLV